MTDILKKIDTDTTTNLNFLDETGNADQVARNYLTTPNLTKAYTNFISVQNSNDKIHDATVNGDSILNSTIFQGEIQNSVIKDDLNIVKHRDRDIIFLGGFPNIDIGTNFNANSFIQNNIEDFSISAGISRGSTTGNFVFPTTYNANNLIKFTLKDTLKINEDVIISLKLIIKNIARDSHSIVKIGNLAEYMYNATQISITNLDLGTRTDYTTINPIANDNEVDVILYIRPESNRTRIKLYTNVLGTLIRSAVFIASTTPLELTFGGTTSTPFYSNISNLAVERRQSTTALNDTQIQAKTGISIYNDNRLASTLSSDNLNRIFTVANKTSDSLLLDKTQLISTNKINKFHINENSSIRITAGDLGSNRFGYSRSRTLGSINNFDSDIFLSRLDSLIISKSANTTDNDMEIEWHTEDYSNGRLIEFTSATSNGVLYDTGIGTLQNYTQNNIFGNFKAVQVHGGSGNNDFRVFFITSTNTSVNTPTKVRTAILNYFGVSSLSNLRLELKWTDNNGDQECIIDGFIISSAFGGAQIQLDGGLTTTQYNLLISGGNLLRNQSFTLDIILVDSSNNKIKSFFQTYTPTTQINQKIFDVFNVTNFNNLRLEFCIGGFDTNCVMNILRSEYNNNKYKLVVDSGELTTAQLNNFNSVTTNTVIYGDVVEVNPSNVVIQRLYTSLKKRGIPTFLSNTPDGTDIYEYIENFTEDTDIKNRLYLGFIYLIKYGTDYFLDGFKNYLNNIIPIKSSLISPSFNQTSIQNITHWDYIQTSPAVNPDNESILTQERDNASQLRDFYGIEITTGTISASRVGYRRGNIGTLESAGIGTLHYYNPLSYLPNLYEVSFQSPIPSSGVSNNRSISLFWDLGTRNINYAGDLIKELLDLPTERALNSSNIYLELRFETVTSAKRYYRMSASFLENNRFEFTVDRSILSGADISTLNNLINNNVRVFIDLVRLNNNREVIRRLFNNIEPAQNKTLLLDKGLHEIKAVSGETGAVHFENYNIIGGEKSIIYLNNRDLKLTGDNLKFEFGLLSRKINENFSKINITDLDNSTIKIYNSSPVSDARQYFTDTNTSTNQIVLINNENEDFITQ